MSNQYLNHEPSRRVFRISKRGLDRIKRRLDKIRAEQSEIYTHFKKKYNRHQLEDIVSDEELQDLRREARDARAISDALSHVEMGTSRRFSY